MSFLQTKYAQKLKGDISFTQIELPIRILMHLLHWVVFFLSFANIPNVKYFPMTLSVLLPASLRMLNWACEMA